jgi:hypothetical protein
VMERFALIEQPLEIAKLQFGQHPMIVSRRGGTTVPGRTVRGLGDSAEFFRSSAMRAGACAALGAETSIEEQFEHAARRPTACGIVRSQGRRGLRSRLRALRRAVFVELAGWVSDPNEPSLPGCCGHCSYRLERCADSQACWPPERGWALRDSRRGTTVAQALLPVGLRRLEFVSLATRWMHRRAERRRSTSVGSPRAPVDS